MRVDKQAAAATSLIMSGLAVLVAMCCFGHAFANWRIGPVPLTIDRIALALLLLAYVALRWFGATAQAGARFADVVLAALVCWLWVRLFGTHWWTEPPIAGDAVPSFRLIAGYLIPAVMFWVAREAPVDARAMRMLHRGLALVGIYLGLTAIFEITGPRALVVPSYVTNPAIGIHFGRARGPMLQSVSLGIALAAGVFSMLSWICWSRRSVRLALGALLAIPLTGICLTYTRSVWIGAALGLVAVYAAMPRTARRTLISALLLTGFVLLLIARSPVTVSEPPAAESDRQAPAAAPADFLPDIKGLALGRSADESRESAQMRLAFAYVSAKMFRDRPLAGVGFGGFPKAKLGYIDAEGGRPELDAIRPYVHHSTLLSLLTECGIVGLVLFLLLVGSWAVAARNARRSHPPPNWIGNQATVMLGVLAMWFVQLLFHELSYATLDNALVFFLAGLTVSASLFQGRHTSAPLRASPGPDAANALGKPAAKVVAGSAAPARVAR